MWGIPAKSATRIANDGKVIVRGFDKGRTLADFMAQVAVSADEIRGITWLQEGSIGVHFKDLARAQEFANQTNGRR